MHFVCVSSFNPHKVDSVVTHFIDEETEALRYEVSVTYPQSHS
jgi:hypothetical protein